MAAGSPSLGTNFSYDPFAPPKRLRLPIQDEVKAPRTDGVAEDGSYSVINDLDKLTAQALADFEARARNPRNDIWGQTLAEDRPENLKRTILDPIFQLTGFQQPDSDPLRTYKTKGGGVVGVNPVSGESRMLVPDPETAAPTPSFTQRQKSDLKLIEDDIFETRKMFNKAPDIDTKSALQGRLNSLERNRRKIFEPEQTQEQQVAPVAQPPIYADWPNAQAGSFIGTPGAGNKFQTQIAPFVAGQTNAPKRLRYNAKTGKLE
jgi:hypothetical protein